MKPLSRGSASLALALALAGFAVPGGAEPPRRGPGPGTANPSALIAAEIAFNRLAREKGQWTAFRETADDEAVMFVPEPVMARDWLKGRDNPPASVQWQPHQVWMSCDGTLGVTKGAWQRPDGSFGYFTTVWRLRKKGEYKWVMDQGDALPAPLEAPEMLSASVAECPPRRPGQPAKKPDTPERRSPGAEGGGTSDDGTLSWGYRVAPDHSRTISLSLRKDGAMAEVLSLSVAAPQ